MNKLKFVSTLVFAFILIVPAGTVLHELGHYAVAKHYYNGVELHKASVTNFDYKFAKGEEFASFLVTLAGPVSTLLISAIGMILISRKSFEKISYSSFSASSIFKILLAYFISREVLLAASLIFTSGVSNSDEYKIPLFLGLNTQYFNIVLFLTTGAICFYILTKTVERGSRVLFLLSAAIGCSIGYCTWVLS
jgi:Zn-dependent protease